MHKTNIHYDDELSAEHKNIILDGLNQNAQTKRNLGKTNGSFSFTITDSNGKFQGGIAGFHYYGCFYIDLLFIIESARRKGYGSTLMQKAEALAKERNSLFIAVNTMDFEAKPFYEKHGYEVEFVREDFEKGAKMYFLRKSL